MLDPCSTCLLVHGADGAAPSKDGEDVEMMTCPPAYEGMSDLKLELQGQIMRLEQFIESHNLRQADPLGESMV